MGRPKQFSREEVLEKAISVFWEKGFAETTVGIVAVVKDHTTLLARLFPAGSVAPVVILAV